jgi:CMP-N,N'-diacetyllegionaminic acid synthase
MLKNNFNTICIIPARAGSKRIKNKNLLKINGKSLVEICIHQAKKSKVFKDIILTSDSEKILKIGKKQKIRCLKRAKNLSRSTTSTDDVISDVISKIEYDFKNIIILQVTSPNRKKESIRKFLNFCIKKKLDKCLSVSELNDNISNYNRYFKPLGKNIRRSQDRKPYLYENGLLYYISKKSFLKDKKISSNKWNFFITNKYESVDINDYDDYFNAKELYKLYK